MKDPAADVVDALGESGTPGRGKVEHLRAAAAGPGPTAAVAAARV